MADINTSYAGTIDQQDPDIVIAQLPGFWPWESNRNVFLPDEIRDKIRKSNLDATATIDAVKVAYTGTAQAERTAWVNSRLTAINNRVAFIQARTEELLNTIKSVSNDTYTTLSKGITAALGLLPVVGSVISFAANQASTGQAMQQYKLQTLVQNYTSDLGELAQIRAQLLKELSGASTGTTDPASSAPTVISAWWYVGGLAAIVAIVWYLKRRNKTKRKR